MRTHAVSSQLPRRHPLIPPTATDPTTETTTLESQVTAHGPATGNTRFTGQALKVDATGSVYLGGSYSGGSLVLGGQTLASPGLVGTPADGFVGRVWVVRRACPVRISRFVRGA